MRKLLIAFLLLFSIPAWAQNFGAQVPDSFMISGTAKRYALVHVPDDYTTSKKYPVLFFFHGAGEQGTTLAELPELLSNGTPPQLIAEGDPFKFINPADHQLYEFIVISIQGNANPGSTSRQQLEYMFPQILSKYSIDTTRIYMTGLSAGGWTTETYLMFQTPGTPRVAAATPMEAALGYSAAYADSLNKAPHHLWGFANPDDNVGKGTISYINAQNEVYPGISRIKIYSCDPAHGCWGTYYDPDYKEEIGGHYMNQYEWMLQFTSDSTNANSALTVSTGTTIDTISNYAPEPSYPASHKIDISPDRIFYNAQGEAFYQVNNLMGDDQGRYLFDEQASVDPANGTNGPPVTAPVIVIKGNLFYPLQYVVDLGATYHITDVRYYDMNNHDTFYVDHGEPGAWVNDSTLDTDEFATWGSIKKAYNSRYLRFTLASGGTRIGEIVVYGAKIDSSAGLTTTPPPASFYHQATNTMGQLMGTNVYGKTPPQLYDSISGVVRKYEDQQWMDTVTTTHDIDQVQFVFDQYMSTGNTYRFYFPDTDSLRVYRRDTNDLTVSMRHMQDLGKAYMPTTMNKPVYALNAGWGRPIDSFAHPTMDPTDPLSYDRLARLEYNFAGVFGSGNVPDDSLQVTYPLYYNQGVLQYLELGNEQDGDWLPLDAYYTPEMLAAYNSALYDGHAGTMGTRFGVKQADPNIKVSMGAVTGLDTFRIKAMYYWAQYKRPDGKVPHNIVNVHYYSNDDTLGLPVGQDPHGLSPEQDSVRKKITNLVKIAHETCPQCEVWWTEEGYDRNRRSPQSVPIIPGKDSAQIQAEWLVRSWLAGAAAGLDRVIQYQIWNEDTGSYLDSSGVNQYNTVGLLADKQAPTGEFDWHAMPAYYYTRSMYTLLHDYRFDGIVREMAGDSVWVYRFRNANHSDSVIYAVWCPTRINDTVHTYFRSGRPGATLQKTVMADHMSNGDQSFSVTDANGNTFVTITENPLFITTTDAGAGTITDSAATPPPPTCDLSITSIAHADETCYLCADGMVTVTATSSAGGMEYSLDGVSWQSSSSFTSVAPDTYTVRVRDANSCTDQGTVTVAAAAPPACDLVITGTSHTDESCYQCADGSIVATVTTTATGLQYSIDGVNWQSGGTFSNLSPGTYTIRARDDNGCTDQGTVTINAAAQPPVETSYRPFMILYKDPATGKIKAVKIN